jgi:hypothetical protein
MKLMFALAAAAFFAAVPVMAQTPAAGRGPAGAAPAQAPPASAQAPAAPIDPAKAAAVRQLMDVTGSGKLGEELIDLVTTQVRQAVANAIPQSDRLQKFMDTFTKNMATRVTAAQIDEAVIPIYAQHLSLEDIQALVAFYQTPSGQHVIKALPLIIQESQNAGTNMARPAAVDTLRQMTTEYPELNQMLPQQGAVSPQGTPAQPKGSQPSLRQLPSPQ